ncbi:MAG: pilus assembly protein PilM [Candidatus Omnitrophica bacterium]|nr:pilus assembly protein PilM [Candidatus Omnitrophota bacterium]MCF7876773.1 pilus assembly protein PilM [Candidatus Omnitrophota bacterium]
MSFFKKKNNIATGLEIGSSWLKIVQINISRGRKEVVNIIKKDIKHLSSEQISRLIKDVSREIKINSDSLVVSIPHYFVTTRTLELPSVNPSEIKEMLDLQIGKQTPYSSEDVISNYQIVDIGSIEGYSRVFLAIVHKDIVQRQLDILENAGLNSSQIGLSSEGLLGWAKNIYKEISDQNPHILIDIGYNNSDFEIVLYGKLVYSKSVSVGAVSFEKDEEAALNKLNKSINHFIYDYQNAVINQDIEKGVITGANLVVNSLVSQSLQEALGFGIEIKDQLDNISLGDSARRNINQDTSDSSLAGIFGLISKHKLDVNFLPHELVIEREVKERAKDIYIAGILLVLVPILISGIFLERIYNKNVYLEKLESKLSEIVSKTKVLDKKIKKIKLIEKESNIRSVSLNILFETYNAVSPEVYLVSLSYDGQNKVTMRGVSTTMAQAFNFADKLDKTDYFKKVETKYANARTTDKGEVVDFEIICLLDIVKKEKN